MSPARRRLRLPALLAAFLLATCGGPSPDTAARETALCAEPESLELGRADYTMPASELPTARVELLDDSPRALEFTGSWLEGEGASACNLVERPRAGQRLEPGETTALELAVSRWTGTWDEGPHRARAVLAYRLLLGGCAGEPAEERLAVPFTFELRCDLDGDGLEAPDCRGEDCDDSDPTVGGGCGG